jgi:predicted DCC family thiol-disulfide oxidoreductase YuxK
MMMEAEMADKAVVLFDGVCNLCNWSVQFIIKHDPNAYFKFASIQSPAGQRLLQKLRVNPEEIDSFILVEEPSWSVRSDAALGVAKHLSGSWPLVTVLRIIPRGVRDWGYNLVAENRYKWFGKPNSCIMPSKELLARFVE